MKTLLASLCLLFAACGADPSSTTITKFAGTYSGTLSRTAACKDGTGYQEDVPKTWVITQRSVVLDINMGEYDQTMSGNVNPQGWAGLGPRSGNPAPVDGGYQEAMTVMGGRLYIQGKTLSVYFTSEDLREPGDRVCESDWMGDLAKQ